MKSLWQKLLADEAGVVLSSEIALVGTVGVLGMVVGLEAVTSAVTSELNDFASAIGALDQSYNYRSIAKIGHGWVRGSGFNDRGDFCDCTLITQTDVFGKTAGGGFSETMGTSQSLVGPSVVVNPAPVVREQVIQERVIDEVLVEPPAVKTVVPVCPDGEIIEEHIIRRRVRADCSTTLSPDCATSSLRPEPTPVLKRQPTFHSGPRSFQEPQPAPEKVETRKPKKRG